MSFIDREYLQTLKDLPRKELIDKWLKNCEKLVIYEARQGSTFCKCKFMFFIETGSLPYKKKYENKFNIKANELLIALSKLFKNCNIKYDFLNTFTVDWS